MKKAFSLAASSIIVLVAAILLIFAILSYLLKSGLTESKNLENQYTAQRADIAMQGLMDGFAKSVEFFGLSATAKELGAHGGISNTGISAAGTYKPVMDAPGGVASWAVARCNNTAGNPTSTIRKRMPFLVYEDYSTNVDTARKSPVLINPADYADAIQDVISGAYKLNVLVQVFMLKLGTVTVDVCQKSCVGGSCSVLCLPAPATASKSGTMIIDVGNNVITNSNYEIYLSLVGSADEVAVVRQVSVSIYDKDVVADPSKLLEKYADSSRKGMPAKSEDLDIGTNPYSAAFVPAGPGIYSGLDPASGFSRGIVWAPDKISVSSPDTVLVKGFGISEEDAKIRYFRMLGMAKFFADNYDAWVKPRMWNRLNQPPPAGVGDHWMPAPSSTCGRPSYANCPADDLTPASEDFRIALENSMAPVETVLNNKFASQGFRWELRVPAARFSGCNLASSTATASYTDAVCNTANMEYYRYKSGWLEFDRCDSAQCPQSCGSRSSCGSGESTCDKIANGCINSNKCFMHYDHRYVFKNIPVQVKITDDRYKMFDAASKSWVPYTFTYFVEVDRIDDDACDSKSGSSDHVCSTQSGPAPAFMLEPAVVVPNELVNPPEQTCYKAAGQSCVYGACPSGQAGGIGTCSTGKNCCAEAIPRTCSSYGGTCYPLSASCPPGAPVVVPKISISDCNQPSSICCKA